MAAITVKTAVNLKVKTRKRNLGNCWKCLFHDLGGGSMATHFKITHYAYVSCTLCLYLTILKGFKKVK